MKTPIALVILVLCLLGLASITRFPVGKADSLQLQTFDAKWHYAIEQIEKDQSRFLKNEDENDCDCSCAEDDRPEIEPREYPR